MKKRFIILAPIKDGFRCLTKHGLSLIENTKKNNIITFKSFKKAKEESFHYLVEVSKYYGSYLIKEVIK